MRAASWSRSATVVFVVTFGDGRVLKHNLSRLWRLRLNPDGPCTESWSRLAGSIVLCPVTRGPGTDVASLVNDSRGWSFEFATAVKSIELERGKAAWVDYRITHTGKGPALAALGETRHVAGLPRNANRNDEVALSYHLTRGDGAMVVFEGLRTPLPRSLAPGESYDLQLRVAAPSQPGTYRLVPDVVHEGVAWMNERAKGDAIVLTVR